MRLVLVCVLAALVFLTLLMLDPVALLSLEWAAATGRFGLRPRIVSAAIGLAILGSIGIAFLWRPKPPIRGRRFAKGAAAKAPRRQPARRAGVPGRRTRQRSKA